MVRSVREPSGHVFRIDRKRGARWYCKYRLPDGRQVQKLIGPAWTDRGRPPAGYFTKRTAEAFLRDLLEQARRGTLDGMVRTGTTFSDACDDYLRWLEHDRARKSSTLTDYRGAINTHLRPRFGDLPLEAVTSREIERWLGEWRADGRVSNRTAQKVLVIFNGIMKRAVKRHGLPGNPLAGIDRPQPAKRLEIDVLSPEEVMQLVRAAAGEQDAALFLTAAFTGLRQGELVALRWQHVDFTGAMIRVSRAYTYGALTTPKSGKVRAVPMAPQVAEALARLSQRERFTADADLVFPRADGSFEVARLLSRRYLAALERAGLRRLRFHDLRHTFGTQMVAHVDLLELREMLGHASITTTERYLHYKPRHTLAAKVAAAFVVEDPAPAQQAQARLREETHGGSAQLT